MAAPETDSTRAAVQQTLTSLRSIDRLERLWTRGLVHAGGPHYRLSGTTGPVSIGEDECFILGTLIAHFRPSTCFIIGNGFGLSSVVIATMMQSHGGSSVVTLDNLSEGDGQRCFDTAEALRHRLNCRILRNKCGSSPEDLVRSAEGAPFDFVFIDGDHSHPQVVEDCRAIQPLLTPRSIMCWHDYWLTGVAASVGDAERTGYHCLKVNSSSEMVFGTRDRDVLQQIASLFEGAAPPVPHYRPIARLMLSRSFFWGWMKTRFTATRVARRLLKQRPAG